MKFNLKTIIALITLASFIWIVFFSFASMSFGPDGRMAGDCPFSAMGTSLCPQDTVAAALHHIGAYSSFLNVPIPSLTVAIMFLLALALTLAVIFISKTLLGPPLQLGIVYEDPPARAANRKITKWLSLFENSPSLG